ncbi:MAG: hypothetical protein JWN30_1305 [Bacilli bacterium]|nr:hypothetical protein [Bacilli bacterium]
MYKRRWMLGLILLISALLVLSGCGAKKTDSSPVAIFDTKTPVTVTFATSGGIFSQDDFNQYVAGPVSKKYPNITVQYINTSVKGSGLSDLVAAGTNPDIVVGYGATQATMRDLGLLDNMEPLIKKYNFDLNRIIPQTLDYVKVNSGTDYLTALPAYNNSFGLFYNKDVFDKFGVPYPTDGMTWQQVGDLGKRMTRTVNGVQYRGFFPDGVNRMINQIELLQVDKNNKSIVTTDPWVKAFQLFNNIYNYPGNSDAPYNKINYGDNLKAFVSGQLAMITGYSSTINALRQAPNVNFDVVTYPQHPDHMGFSTNVDTGDLSITSSCQNKDAAFMVIQTILSDEVQLDFAKNGKMSVLKNDQVVQQFGSGIPEFQGRTVHLNAMVKLKPSVPNTPKISGSDTNQIIIDAFDSILAGKKDINTALRDADDAMNKLITTKQAQNGQ